MLGGCFTHHPEDHVNVCYRFDEKHEPSNAKESFEINDEHYFIESNEGISNFLNSKSKHGESVGGWAKSYGEGKICSYAPKHDKEDIMKKIVRNDLKDIIKWLFHSYTGN